MNEPRTTRAPKSPSTVKLPCSHGWHVKCRKCAKFADELEAQFWQDVFFGKYNARGYTPAEWAAKEKRAACGERTKRTERVNISKRTQPRERANAVESRPMKESEPSYGSAPESFERARAARARHRG